MIGLMADIETRIELAMTKINDKDNLSLADIESNLEF
jgi:hypothetical protein